MKLPIRFLNMAPEQVQRRYDRDRKRKWRGTVQGAQRCSALEHPRDRKRKRPGATAHRNKKPPVPGALRCSALEHRTQSFPRRPCCGLPRTKCRCLPPSGLCKRPLNALAKRFLNTPLKTVADTTDVMAFQTLMRSRCQSLPLSGVLTYCFVHVVFNQAYLLTDMVNGEVFLQKAPWVNWKRLQVVIRRAKAQHQIVRSSNFRSITLKKVMLQSGHVGVALPTDPVARDVLMCRIVGYDSIPHSICALYEAAPSRDLWTAMLHEWLHQAHSRASQAFGHYYLKCSLDRLFAVRNIDPGTIGWWPTDCPSYVKWYKILYPKRCFRARLDTWAKFKVLCHIYVKLRSVQNRATFPEALAQTCWMLREERQGHE